MRKDGAVSLSKKRNDSLPEPHSGQMQAARVTHRHIHDLAFPESEYRVARRNLIPVHRAAQAALENMLGIRLLSRDRQEVVAAVRRAVESRQK